MPEFKSSKAAWTFIAFAALMIAIKLLFDFYPYDFPARDQASAFTWPVVLGIIALGALGFAADRALGMPEPFTDAERDRAGLWISIGLGVACGLFTVAHSLTGAERHPYISATDWPHVLLPWSIPFYLFGAILLEFMLRL